MALKTWIKVRSLTINNLRFHLVWPVSCLDSRAMTRLPQLLGIALISAVVSAEPQQVPANESERQPGTLRLSGLNDSDRVLLDGELIGNGKRIAQFGSKLLVSPGEYTVTIVSATDQSCERHVSVRENRTVVASCSTESDERQLVD